MGVIWLLKALSDISVYYLFAAPVAAYFGGTGLLLCALLQAAAYAIARSTKRKWFLSLSLLAVVLGYWLCRALPADLIAQTPALVYLILQYTKNAPLPKLSRLREGFESLWKPILGAMVLALIFGFFAAPIPFALLAFAANAALLRTLRHAPETYLQPRFQLMNLGILSCVPLTALVLGTGPVAKGVGTGLHWFYQQLLVPFLVWIMYLPGKLMQWIIDMLRPMMDIEPDTVDNTLPVETVENSAENTQAASQDVPPGWDTVKIILIALLALVAVIGIILLFRKLAKGDGDTSVHRELRELRTALEQEKSREVSLDTPAVQSVRKHYRRYLKLCVKSGIPVQPSSTSGEVRDGAAQRKALQPHAERIRQLYIRARYAGLATKEDAREISVLYAQSKKEK